MMRLIKNEFRKISGAKTVAALLAALLFASALTCFYFTGGDRPAYSAEEEAEIKRFYEEFSADAAAYSAFDTARKKAASDIAEELARKYTEAIEKAGDDQKAIADAEAEFEKAYSDPATFATHIYSDVADDITLISAFHELTEIKEKFEVGVNLILSQAERNAEELRTEYGMTPSDPLYQYQIYAYNKYKNVTENADVGEEFVHGWDKLLTFSYGDIFLFAALILLVGAVYFTDRQTGMTPILRSSKNGRAKLSAAKICAVSVSAAALSLLFSAAAFVTVWLRRGYSDPSVSVQNVAALSLFPETFSVLRYYVYSVFVKILSAVSFAAVLSLFAAVISSAPVYYLAGAAFFGAQFSCGLLDTVRYPILRLNLFSICNFIPITERLYIFQPFTGCLGYHLLAPILCATVIAVFGCFAVIAGAGARHVSKPKKAYAERIKQALSNVTRKTPKKRSARYKRSLFLWETEKTVGRASVCIVLTVLFAVQIAFCFIARVQSTPQREQRIYARFILAEASGPFSTQGARVEALLSVYTDRTGCESKIVKATDAGLFTAEAAARVKENAEFIFRNELYDDFGYAYDVYYRNKKLYDGGTDAEFIDESGVSPLITGGASYALYAAVLIVCIGVWTIEYGGKSHSDDFVNILFASKKGRAQTYFVKLFSALTVSLILSVLFYAAELLILLPGRNFSCLTSPLCSVGAYADCGVGMTVGEYLVFVYLCRLAASLLLAAVTLPISALAKDFAAAFGAAAGVTLLPTLLYKAGLRAAGYVSYGDFQSVNGMVLFSSNETPFDKPLHAFALYAALFFAAAVILLIISGYKIIGKRRKT